MFGHWRVQSLKRTIFWIQFNGFNIMELAHASTGNSSFEIFGKWWRWCFKIHSSTSSLFSFLIFFFFFLSIFPYFSSYYSFSFATRTFSSWYLTSNLAFVSSLTVFHFSLMIWVIFVIPASGFSPFTWS